MIVNDVILYDIIASYTCSKPRRILRSITSSMFFAELVISKQRTVRC